MVSLDSRLATIAAKLDEGKKPPHATVRELLNWFGSERRGFHVVNYVRDYLDAFGLATVPDFQGVHIDSEIEFALNKEPEDSAAAVEEPAEGGLDETKIESDGPIIDPIYRIGMLNAAISKPVGVSPNSTLEQVVTLMMANNFSQLPVYKSEYEVAGIVSWKTLGTKLALGVAVKEAREFMEHALILRNDHGLFSAIGQIVENDYVLIRDPKDNRISGIVTNSDLADQFRSMSEHYLTVSEIEKQIRRLISTRGQFSEDEIRSVCELNGDDYTGISSLTFGAYIRIVENKEFWARIGLAIDRVIFCDQLNQIRRIRNDVMHFNTDSMAPEDVRRLREFSRFLQILEQSVPM